MMDCGSIVRILEEAQWELEMRGLGHVKFYLSGGISEEDIPVLNPVVHGYGIGTSISNAAVIDFAMDIVEIEGKPFLKRGKWSGSKRVFLCTKYGTQKITPLTLVEIQTCSCGGVFTDMLNPVLDDGKLLV